MKTKLLKKLRRKARNIYRIVAEDKTHFVVQMRVFDAISNEVVWTDITRPEPSPKAASDCISHKRRFMANCVKQLRKKKRVI